MIQKQWIVLLTFLPAMALGLCSQSDAQSNVALVDVGAVFKSHSYFSQQLQQLKTEAEQFDRNSVQLREQMIAKRDKLKMYTPGSDDYKSAETALAQELARVEVEQRDQLRKLAKREAQLHFDTYQEVKRIIGDFCAQQNIRLVLRHNQQELDIDNPNSIMQEVNSNIVYYSPTRDITAAIIQQLNGAARLPGNTSLPGNKTP